MKYALVKGFLLICVALVSTTATSNDAFNQAYEQGGDVYISSYDAIMKNPAGRDAFIVGFSVELTGDVSQDAHAAGFDVDIESDVAGNLYAAGSNVRIEGRVGKDLTVSGFTVRLNDDAMILGNARIAAGTIDIDSPIGGSLLASGGTIRLNESVLGDVSLIAPEIEFGDGAVIEGTLSYSSTNEIDIPSSVISSDRVIFTPIKDKNTFREIKDTVDDSVPDFWPITLANRLTGLMVLLAFLLIIAVVFLAFAPRTVEYMRQRATEHAWRALFYGFIGLSALIGAIPLSLITIVGIPLAPIALLALIVIWTLGYLLGVYVITARVWRAIDFTSDSVFANLLVLASGLIAMVLVNFIPFFGWLINLGVVLFGIGAMTYVCIERLVQRHESTGPMALPVPPVNGVDQ